MPFASLVNKAGYKRSIILMIPKYEAEINKLAEEHLPALLDLYAISFHERVKVGQRNAVICHCASLSSFVGGISRRCPVVRI